MLLKKAEVLERQQQILRLPQLRQNNSTIGQNKGVSVNTRTSGRLSGTHNIKIPRMRLNEKTIQKLNQRHEQEAKNQTLQLKSMKKDLSKSNLSVNTSYLKGLNGGASPRSLNRDSSAASFRLPRFLNPSGPGDYDLPSSFGSKVVQGNLKNGPSPTLKARLPIPKTRDFADMFKGSISPGHVYDLQPDNHIFKKIKVSVGKSERFFEESHIKRIKALPVMYQEKLDKDIKNYQKVSMGYGQKGGGFEKKNNYTPGPIYNYHEVASIAYQSPYKKKNSVPGGSFGNRYDKWDKVIYRGQEKHLHGREGKGPGAYETNHDTIAQSASRRSLMSGLSKGDRGLLTIKKDDRPSPMSYYADLITIRKKQGNAIMPTATRDIHFAKYNSVHKALIEKGIV
ncbi:hypothetical protein FGO68_gene13908 [Halteria grandinella]|uniref:Uncharacterized protein n=1 Tax=Halteria grandinella TaxID=5974 RepID=A0A8J8NTH4_HALGN|nr:hypothetical protein FGO68_gene13908 [Halteria grandinella]